MDPQTKGEIALAHEAVGIVEISTPQTELKFPWGFMLRDDPASHYSLNLTYENGRTAPNFEYLNKVTSGIKLIY